MDTLELLAVIAHAPDNAVFFVDMFGYALPVARADLHDAYHPRNPTFVQLEPWRKNDRSVLTKAAFMADLATLPPLEEGEKPPRVWLHTPLDNYDIESIELHPAPDPNGAPSIWLEASRAQADPLDPPASVAMDGEEPAS